MREIPSLDMSRAMRVLMMRSLVRENFRLRAGRDDESQDCEREEWPFHVFLH